jgi:hypothetical protein
MRSARTARGFTLSVVVAACVLSGCKTEVQTGIDVQRDGTVTVTSTLELDGAVREAIEQDPALGKQLEDVLVERFGDVTVVDAGRRYQVTIDPAAMDATAGLTGVSAPQVTTAGDVATVDVAVSAPAEFVAALTAAVTGWPDGAEVLATAQAATVISVEVSFPGEVIDTVGFVADGNTARYEAALGDLGDTVALRAVGRTDVAPTWIRWGAAAAVAAVAVAITLRRRR